MSINKDILRLALPSVAATVTTPLLGLVDTAVTGHMGSPVFLGAIAVGAVMFNMLYWLFSFLRAGTSGLAAQAYGGGGARVTAAGAQVLRQSLTVALAIGLLMVVLQWPLRELLVWLLDPGGASSALAGRYFRILIYGAPATLATYAVSGWLLGMQRAKALVVISVVTNVVNIALSLWLVYGVGWQIEGVATGSLVAQWAGFGAACWCAKGTGAGRWLWQRGQPLQWGRFFRVNVDVMLRTALLIAVTVWFTHAGASQGVVTLGANALLMQLFLLFSYVMDGFAFAGEALAGSAVGGRDMSRLRSVVRGVMRWGLALALLFTAFYFCFGQWLLGLLSSEGEVVARASEYLPWAVSVPLAGFAAFGWDGVYIGATLTRQLLWSMAGATALFFLTWLSLGPFWGNHALWLAFVAYLGARGLLQWILFRCWASPGGSPF